MVLQYLITFPLNNSLINWCMYNFPEIPASQQGATSGRYRASKSTSKFPRAMETWEPLRKLLEHVELVQLPSCPLSLAVLGLLGRPLLLTMPIGSKTSYGLRSQFCKSGDTDANLFSYNFMCKGYMWRGSVCKCWGHTIQKNEIFPNWWSVIWSLW